MSRPVVVIATLETSEAVYHFAVTATSWDTVICQVLANQPTSGTLSMCEVAVVQVEIRSERGGLRACCDSSHIPDVLFDFFQ